MPFRLPPGKLLGFLLAFGVALGLAVGLPAQRSRSRQEALEDIRAQVGRLEDRLGKVAARADSVAGRLEQTRLELELQEVRVAEAVAARDLAVDRAEQSELRVAELEVAVREAREDLRRRLVGLYRLGRHGHLRLFLSVDPDEDFLPALRALRYLVQRDARSVERYVERRDRLAAERETLVARRREAERWAAEETQRRDEIATLERRQARLLAELARERRQLRDEVADLERREERLTDLMVALARVAGDEALESGEPIEEYRGVLDWPMDGEVTAGFGPRLDPRYGTKVPHNGIELSGAPGQRVHAVFPGKVLFAAPLEGYGQTVVVLHPGRAFTLYAGLERLLVSSEDVISLEEPVGVSPGRLYFEIRLDKRPENPLDWLR